MQNQVENIKIVLKDLFEVCYRSQTGQTTTADYSNAGREEKL